MLLSVFNKRTGMYDIYQNDDVPIFFNSGRGSSSLGAVPEDVSPALPPGSEYVGTSDVAEGVIVRIDYSWKDLLFTTASFIFAKIAFKIISDLFNKR